MTTNTQGAADRRAALSQTFQSLSDRAYCNYIEQMGRDECLGWEHKVKTGKFGHAELTAHTKAGEQLGRHKAFQDAANALTGSNAALVPSQQPEETEATHLRELAAPSTDQVEEILRERDDADDFIDALLDEVLGHERPEWSSAYGRADALNDVRERMTALHKPAVDKAWDRSQSAMEAPQQPAPSPVPSQPIGYLNPKVIGPDGKIDAPGALTYSSRPCGGWTFPIYAAAPTALTAQADTQPAPVQDEREEFEAWLRSVWTAGYQCPKFDSGKYVHGEAQRFWDCWQARAARAPADSELEDAARYRLLRRGQHWSVIDGIGNDLRAEALDAAVDAASKQGATP